MRRGERGLLRPADRGGVRGRRTASGHPQPGPHDPERDGHGDVRVPQATQADLQLGDQMTTEHLWLHFTRMSPVSGEVPVIVRGEGQYVYDQKGKRYLDGLSGLFVSQIGHGRKEAAEAGARQAAELAYFPLWSSAHPRPVHLPARLPALSPAALPPASLPTT